MDWLPTSYRNRNLSSQFSFGFGLFGISIRSNHIPMNVVLFAIILIFQSVCHSINEFKAGWWIFNCFNSNSCVHSHFKICQILLCWCKHIAISDSQELYWNCEKRNTMWIVSFIAACYSSISHVFIFHTHISVFIDNKWQKRQMQCHQNTNIT